MRRRGPRPRHARGVLSSSSLDRLGTTLSLPKGRRTGAKPRDNATSRFLRFNAVSAGGFVVQLSTVALLTFWLAIPEVAATGAGVAAAIVHNFLWHRRWTWADRPASIPRRSSDVATFLRFVTANGLISIAGNLLIVAVLVDRTMHRRGRANVVAVGVCGLLNYQIGDRFVFRRGTP